MRVMKGVLKYFGKYLLLLASVAVFLMFVNITSAIDGSATELEEQIEQKKSEIDRLNGQMDSYREKVSQYSSETASLINDIALIENQIIIAELDVSMTQLEIQSQQLELQLVDGRIEEQTAQLESQKEMLEEMIFELHTKNDIGLIEILFGSEDFNELFDQVQYLESINEDLHTVLRSTKQTKENLEIDKGLQEDQLNELLDSEKLLEERIVRLEMQQNAKDVLVRATQESEVKYRVLMSELRQERQLVTGAISSLQSELENRLVENDDLGGDPGVMSWPLTHGIITATFHDPTYPYRHLFEHSGLDVAVPQGYSVMSSAPGIVAWARTGRSYGNYVMVIHSGGYATLYAHMSRIDVEEDQYVARGEQIGLSGNTGLSTGPHLHYEVRLNGIPVNPQSYLVGDVESYY
jgi:murein DD-endopeptidase MepM/ murein hydrolase activator NlpD